MRLTLNQVKRRLPSLLSAFGAGWMGGVFAGTVGYTYSDLPYHVIMATAAGVTYTSVELAMHYSKKRKEKVNDFNYKGNF